MKIYISAIVLCCFTEQVLATLQCTDWKGQSVADGKNFYPKKDDACYVCRCSKGFQTMCKTVSCAAPDCKPLRRVPGKCCEFECLDKDGNDFSGSGNQPNLTGLTPFDVEDVEVNDTASMTDLGLRLVASTVTTFLILALLLFLIHRFRQRRLLLALRRYRRRHDTFDDSENVSYSPDYFGIPCPPYEDPPPPYSPPKPPHFHSQDGPPPYEAIDSNGNNQQPPGSLSDSRAVHCIQGCAGNQSNPEGSTAEHGTSVVSGEAVTPVNGSSIHNGGLSDVFSSSGQSERATSVTDIEELSSNVESSKHTSPTLTRESGNQLPATGRVDNVSETSSDCLSADADATVRRFLDRQFGSLARDQRFTPTMSQSWTSAQFSAVMPNFRQSASVGSFSANRPKRPNSMSFCSARDTVMVDEAVGSSRPFKVAKRACIKPSTLPSLSKATRISYLEPDEMALSSGTRVTNGDQDNTCSYPTTSGAGVLDDTETNYSFNSCSVEAQSNCTSFKGDNSNSASVARRQDALRELRLSHLLNSPPSSFDSPVSPSSPQNSGPFPLQRSQSILSDNSMFSVCSETGEKRSGGTKNTGTVLSNDAQYPENSYRQFLRSSLSTRGSVESRESQSDDRTVESAANEMRSCAGPANEMRSSSGPANEMRSSSGPANEIRSSAGPANEMRSSSGPANEMRSSSGPANEMRSSSGPANEIRSSAGLVRRQESACGSEQLNGTAENLLAGERETFPGNLLSGTGTCNSFLRPSSMYKSYPPNRADTSTGAGGSQSGENKHKDDTVRPQNYMIFPFNMHRSYPDDSAHLEMSNFPVRVPTAVQRLVAASHMTNSPVPTHEMRAFASQYYACEQEDRVGKKDRSRNVHKRHSAGCFPVHKGQTGSSGRSPQGAQKRSPKVRRISSKSKDRPSKGMDREVTENSHRNSGHASNATHVPNSKVVKRRSGVSDRKDYGFIDNDPAPPLQPTAADIRRDVPAKCIHPLVISSVSDSSDFLHGAHNCVGGRRLVEQSQSPSHRGNPELVHQRSRSDVNRNNFDDAHVLQLDSRNGGNKKSAPKSKKKSRQSFPGTNAFHRELEHVLSNQKAAVTSSVHRTLAGQGSGSQGLQCAVTDV